MNLREAEVSAEELKQLMKDAMDSEYTASTKLAYEKQARKDHKVSLG